MHCSRGTHIILYTRTPLCHTKSRSSSYFKDLGKRYVNLPDYTVSDFICRLTRYIRCIDLLRCTIFHRQRIRLHCILSRNQIPFASAVVYDCGGKRDLIPGQYAVKSYALSMEDGTTKQIDAAYISGEPAEEIRNGAVRQIDVTLA